MKALTNQRALWKAYNDGFLDDVAKDLNRYFPIETDQDWEDDQGIHRQKSFLVKHSKGVARWHVEQVNGAIVTVGCVLEARLDRPFYTA